MYSYIQVVQIFAKALEIINQISQFLYTHGTIRNKLWSGPTKQFFSTSFF